MGGFGRFTQLMMVTVFAVSQVPRMGHDLQNIRKLLDSIEENFEYLKSMALEVGVHPDAIIRECSPSSPQELQGKINKCVLRIKIR